MPVLGGFHGTQHDPAPHIAAPAPANSALCAPASGAGGVFALDVYNPDLAKLQGRVHYPVFRYRSPGRAEPIEVWVRNRFDPRRVNRVEFEHRGNGSILHRERHRLRCFFPGELDRALKESGLSILSKFGGFDRSPFRENSPLQILVTTYQPGKAKRR